MSQGMSYFVDIVLCIDCTGSMGPVIDRVKASALKFYSLIERRMEEKNKHIDQLRIRVIAFKDFWADHDPINAMPDFIDLRTEADKFEAFVNSLSAAGGGDDPENGMEALALALRSPWADVAQSKGRRIVVMWTDASAHSLEKAATAPPANYPENMPKNIDELTDMWDEHPPSSRRLLMYTPDATPWSEIGGSWDNCIHYPSKAGEGLSDHEFGEILEAIANSV